MASFPDEKKKNFSGLKLDHFRVTMEFSEKSECSVRYLRCLPNRRIHYLALNLIPANLYQLIALSPDELIECLLILDCSKAVVRFPIRGATLVPDCRVEVDSAHDIAA